MRKIISLVLAVFCFMINVAHAQQDRALSQDIPEMAVDISPLLIGELFPFQDLKDVNGQIVNMGTIISQKPTILVFYRGDGVRIATSSSRGCRKSKKNCSDWVIRL